MARFYSYLKFCFVDVKCSRRRRHLKHYGIKFSRLFIA